MILLRLTAAACAARSQSLITHQKPVHLRQLSGTVFDSSGGTIPYALIELRDANDHHAIASTFADGYGKFFFDKRKRGETLEIQITLKGFEIVRYEVVVSRFGRARLRVILPVAA